MGRKAELMLSPSGGRNAYKKCIMLRCQTVINRVNNGKSRDVKKNQLYIFGFGFVKYFSLRFRYAFRFAVRLLKIKNSQQNIRFECDNDE